jgi:hypothetical protein
VPFKKGDPKPEGSGRKPGVKNLPVSIKFAWKEFVNEQGGEMKEWAREVMFEMPNIAIVGDVSQGADASLSADSAADDRVKAPAPVEVIDKCQRWGIGLPAGSWTRRRERGRDPGRRSRLAGGPGSSAAGLLP